MQGQRLAEKSYNLIKSMLMQGYSAKKTAQMLPDEIKVSMNVIYRIANSGNYEEYCGKRPEPQAQKVIAVTPYTQTKEIVEAMDRVNERLDRLCEMMGEILNMLK